jgi:hypothetical protein
LNANLAPSGYILPRVEHPTCPNCSVWASTIAHYLRFEGPVRAWHGCSPEIEGRTAVAEKCAFAQGHRRAVQGWQRMLVIMDQGLIKQAKMAGLEDDMKISHAVEEAVRERRKGRKAAT